MSGFLRPEHFAGKTVFITAGASGMGRCFATRCAEHGANVVIADIDADGARATAASLPSAIGIGCDVRASDQIEAARNEARHRFGEVDLVMSHAGITLPGPLTSFTDTDWTTILDLNVIGMARMLRAFAPDMMARGSGHFILTSSSLALIAGHPLSALAAPYIASKAAVIGLAQSAAIALAPHGVGVTLFSPDLTDTNFAKPPKSPQGAPRPTANLVQTARQTPEQAVDALFQALENGRFLASATPDFLRALEQQAKAGLDPLQLADLYAAPTSASIP